MYARSPSSFNRAALSHPTNIYSLIHGHSLTTYAGQQQRQHSNVCARKPPIEPTSRRPFSGITGRGKLLWSSSSLVLSFFLFSLLHSFFGLNFLIETVAEARPRHKGVAHPDGMDHLVTNWGEKVVDGSLSCKSLEDNHLKHQTLLVSYSLQSARSLYACMRHLMKRPKEQRERRKKREEKKKRKKKRKRKRKTKKHPPILCC